MEWLEGGTQVTQDRAMWKQLVGPQSLHEEKGAMDGCSADQERHFSVSGFVFIAFATVA